VAASRPDLLAILEANVPADWSTTIALGRSAIRRNMRLAMALGGVHSLMTLFTLCANLGKPFEVNEDRMHADRETLRTALAMLRELLSLCPVECLGWSSIAVHDHMVARDDLVFCPAVYCYATYAEADQRRPLRFHDFPGPRGHGGSTIGGTGLGISSHCPHPEAARAYARFVATAEAQFAFAMNHGQPALATVWDDDVVNARYGDCFRAVRTTMEACWTRPRYDGYLAFQAHAGDLLEHHLRGAVSEHRLLEVLEQGIEERR
jgi:multiple sugar transport system substrate-binding protein